MNNMNEEKNPLEEYIRKIVIETLKNYPVDSTLKHQDAKVIIEAIMPEIDKLIAKRIKIHINEMMKYFRNKFKMEE